MTEPPPAFLRPRDPAFIGRDTLIDDLRKRLSSGDRVVLHGPDGVGKSETAAEYAHRFAADYDKVLWVDAGFSQLVDTTAEAFGGVFRGRDRWLLILDDLTDPVDALPDGTGHILVTSRTDRGWAGIAEPVAVTPFARDESVGLLRGRLPRLTAEDAEQLADAAGDLSLGLRLAAATLAETAMAPGAYLETLAGYAWEAADGSALTSAALVAAAHLQDADPAAADLLRLCALLAPEPIPPDLFAAGGTDGLPPTLAAVADVVGLDAAVERAARRIVRFGLARDDSGLVVHATVQAAIRDAMPPAAGAGSRVRAERLLVAAQPHAWGNIWQRHNWRPFVPHLFAVDPVATTDDELRRLAAMTIQWLNAKASPLAAFRAGSYLEQEYVNRHGPDDRYALMIAAEVEKARQKIHGPG
jgi:hypothetical protein